MSRQLGNPGVFGLATFGFALSALSFQVLVNPDTAGATLYAILVAALGETIAGMWAIARGNTYVAGILTTFGIWLFGFYMMLTQGEELGLEGVMDFVGLWCSLREWNLANLTQVTYQMKSGPLSLLTWLSSEKTPLSVITSLERSSTR